MARIMIVDDSTVMRMNLRKILTSVGHTIVAEAQNGKEACSLYEKHLPDLVTMDISMPIMSGVDATRAIVSRFPSAVIIMISALNQKKMVYDALKNGAKHYIIKPIDKENVISVFNEVLITDAATKLEPSKEQIERQKEKEHFLVENMNGTFFITIGNKFDDQDMENLSMALQGIKFIKPLKIRLDFNELKSLEDRYLTKFALFAKEIKNLGGSYESIALDNGFRKKLDEWEARL